MKEAGEGQSAALGRPSAMAQAVDAAWRMGRGRREVAGA